MNDPGTEQPIADAAEDIEPYFDGQADDNAKREEEAEEEQEHNYDDESRWWFASTGCPLIAGTFGPLANAFSICALVKSWRVYIPDGGSEEHGIHIEDPKWLIAVNAVSLVAAIIANTALLLNMSERLRFKIAQPISVVGFFLAGLLLIGDLAAISASPTYWIPAGDPAAPAIAHALSGAFYYGLQAAVIYLIITALMILTAVGAWRGHYKSEFRLTVAQRTLMLQTMSFVVYLLLGALVFSHVEGWDYLDAVYWADLTLLTIGLGSDFHPSTHAGRSLLFFFAIGGIITIGLVIGSIRTLVLERGKKKISARILEKKRRRAINSVDPKKHSIKISRFETRKFDNSNLDVSARRKLEFQVMRDVQDRAERDRKWMSLAISTTAAFSLWFLGALVFTLSERSQHWNYFDSLYFAYVCLLTIGYGDFLPLSVSGRAFFVLWTLLAVPTLTILISDMGDTVVQAFSNLTIWIGSLTVLPGENGVKNSVKMAAQQFSLGRLDPRQFETEQAPGFIPESEQGKSDTKQGEQHEDTMMSGIAYRLSRHLEEEELREAAEAAEHGDMFERDIHFYHFVLAKEIRALMFDINSSPPKRYEWDEWEYFLKLIGDGAQSDSTGSDAYMVPQALRTTTEVARFRAKGQKQSWSWLGRDSPLMGYKTESEWILERISTTLERELQEVRKMAQSGGSAKDRKPPPISLGDMLKSNRIKVPRSKLGVESSGERRSSSNSRV